MSSATMPTLSLTGMLVVAVFWAAQLSVALNIEFCSNFNTGAENQAGTCCRCQTWLSRNIRVAWSTLDT